MLSPYEKTATPQPPDDLPVNPVSSHRPLQPAVLPPEGFTDENSLRRRHKSYTLRREVGRGTFGEVWEALQVTLNRVVAVKRVRTDDTHMTDSELSRQLFRREAVIAGQLDHPNIVPVYDLGVDAENRPLMAMKLIDGLAWSDAIVADAKLPEAEFFRAHLPHLVLVARAVSFAHARGVIHRDLKPSQVMIGKFGEVFLMDWGLAVEFSPPAEKSGNGSKRMPAGYATPLHDASNPAGTVAFMAPEQTESTSARLGPWTDVYLLGGMLYYLLTLTYPHPQSNGFEAFQHAARGVVEPPHDRAPSREIAPELADLAMEALAPNPTARVASAAEFANRLDDFLSGNTRRAESRKLTREAADQISSWTQSGNGSSPTRHLHSELSYHTLDATDQLIQRALELWPQNPEALQAQRALLEIYANQALHKADLKLAAAVAERIEYESLRTSLLTRVTRAEQRALRHARQRTIALWSSALLLLLSVAVALAVMRQNQFERAASESEYQKAQDDHAQLRAKEDDKKRQEQETRRSQLLAEYRNALAATKALAIKSLPLPTSPIEKDDWSLNYLKINSEVAARAQAALDDLDHRSAEVISQGSPTEPDSPELLLSRGVLALLRLSGTRDTAAATELFHRAALAAPERFEPFLGLSVAAARADKIPEAVDFAQHAISRINPAYGYDFDVVTELITETFRMKWHDMPLAPGETLLEAWPQSPTASSVEVSPGGWEPYGIHKSAAPRTTPMANSGSLLYTFYGPYEKKLPLPQAAVKFKIAPQQPGPKNVYVTWPVEANATPVYYLIHDSHGTKKLALTQDGFGTTGASNANFWIDLGQYDFNSAGGWVEVIANEDVRPLVGARKGEACVDAILLTDKKLTEATTAPLLAEPSGPIPDEIESPANLDLGPAREPEKAFPGESDLTSAKSRVAAEQKNLLAFCFYPVSAAFVHPLNHARDYCENRLFTHPRIREIMKTRFVSLALDQAAFPDAAKELKTNTRGISISIIDPNGKTLAQFSDDDLIMSPNEFLARLAPFEKD